MEISIFSPSLLTVSCTAEIDGVGLTAARNTMLLPSLMPPKTPPAWLVFFVSFPSFMTKLSLFSLPVIFAASKPLPISKPLTAPIESIAFPREASSLSNTGSPIPGIMPSTTHSMIPPIESPSCIFCVAYASTFAAASLSGIVNAFSRAACRSNFS